MAKFNPFDTSSLYDDNKARWKQELDFSEVTKNVLQTYIPAFSNEENIDDLKFRKDMTCSLDMIQDAIDLRVQSLWRSEPVRQIEPNTKYTAILETLVSDADTKGTSINDFMRNIYRQYLITGSDIIVQMTGAEGQIITKQDEQEAGLRPFMLQRLPLDRYDWACDIGGNFEYARYFMGEKFTGVNADQVISIFLELQGNIWTVYTVNKTKDDFGKDVSKITSKTGTNNDVGVTPIVKAYYHESAKPGQECLPLSLITRPVIIAYVVLNLKSQADVELLAAIPTWFGSGMKKAPDRLGPNMVITDDNDQAKLVVVQGSVDHIKEKREWINKYITEEMRLLKYRGTMAAMDGNAGSGVKLALEYNDLNNELLASASQMEDIEIQAMRLAVMLATGDDIPRIGAGEAMGYSVRYAREFNLEPIGAIIEHIKALNEGDISMAIEEVPAINKELLKKLTNTLMQMGSPEYIEALEQIDKMTFETEDAEPNT